MDLVDVLKIIGSILGGIAAIAVGIIGYLLRDRYNSMQSSIRKNADSILQVKSNSEESEKELWKRFGGLPSEYVPRPEFRAIIDSIRSDAHDTKEMLKEIRSLLLEKML